MAWQAATLIKNGWAHGWSDYNRDQSRSNLPFRRPYHQQYLAKPGSRPYCSAMPTQITLEDFEGADYRLPATIWSHYDWSINHCVLRSDNTPISLSR